MLYLRKTLSQLFDIILIVPFAYLIGVVIVSNWSIANQFRNTIVQLMVLGYLILYFMVLPKVLKKMKKRTLGEIVLGLEPRWKEEHGYGRLFFKNVVGVCVIPLLSGLAIVQWSGIISISDIVDTSNGNTTTNIWMEYAYYLTGLGIGVAMLQLVNFAIWLFVKTEHKERQLFYEAISTVLVEERRTDARVYKR